MDVVMVVVVVVVAAFLAVLLRHQRPEFAMAIGVLAGVAVLLLVIGRIAPVLDTLRNMLNASGLPGEYGQILFKALGIGLLTQLAADACRDADEGAMAAKAELAGKAAMLLLALPLFEKVAELAASLIGGTGASG